jgi:hypothetical protein
MEADNSKKVRCQNCRSQRWEEVGDVNKQKGTKLFQCQFCKRVVIANEIPNTEDPMEVM